MNKKLKIFLSVSIIILVAAGSYLLYTFKFKEYDVADEEVEKSSRIRMKSSCPMAVG